MGIVNKLRKFNNDADLFILTLPGLLFFLIFSYLPMFGIVIAFKNYSYDKKIWGSDWVGLDNFKFFFTSQDAFRITRNTILYNAGIIIVGTSAAIIIALMLNALSRNSVRIFQTVYLMPYFLSWVVISYVLYAFLNPDLGIINKLLGVFSVEPVMWYLESKYWPFVLFIASIWKNTGYNAIIFYTGLMSIDTFYYEAADIDGASKLQQVFKISIPLIRPLIILITLLAIGRIFYSDFGLFYFLPMGSGSLFQVTDVLDTYIYRSLRTSGDIGMASAAGLYQSVVGFLLVLISNRIVNRIDPASSIF